MISVWAFDAIIDVLENIDSSINLARLRKIFDEKYVWLMLDVGNVTATINGVDSSNLDFGDHEKCSISFVLSENDVPNIKIGGTMVVSVAGIPIANVVALNRPLKQ